MTDYDSEQGRELRRARLTRIRPRNAEDMLPKASFDAEYRQFHIVRRELMPDIEESQRVMFCPACQEHEDDELQRARKLHVSYNEDPLRNYRALVTVACKGCGWNEIIPVAAPEALTEDELSVLREKLKYETQDKMEQYRAQYNSALSQSQYANAAMQRQVGKSVGLAAAYGAGPQLMKSLIAGTNIRLDTRTPSPPTHGQALADHIWSDYEELDRMRREAAQSRPYVESKKLREQYMRDAAEQMTSKIDSEIMSELKKVPPIAPRAKYRPLSAPPTPEELRAAIMAAPPEARPSLLEKLKGYFR